MQILQLARSGMRSESRERDSPARRTPHARRKSAIARAARSRTARSARDGCRGAGCRTAASVAPFTAAEPDCAAAAARLSAAPPTGRMVHIPSGRTRRPAGRPTAFPSGRARAGAAVRPYRIRRSVQRRAVRRRPGPATAAEPPRTGRQVRPASPPGSNPSRTLVVPAKNLHRHLGKSKERHARGATRSPSRPAQARREPHVRVTASESSPALNPASESVPQHGRTQRRTSNLTRNLRTPAAGGGRDGPS